MRKQKDTRVKYAIQTKETDKNQKGIFESQECIEITIRYLKKSLESFGKDMEEIIFRHVREDDWIEKVEKK